MQFVPAPGHVEIRPLKEEGIIIDPNKKYEEMGEVLSVAEDVTIVRPGDTIFFDSYACRATPEIEGVKHYVVNVVDGGLLGIIHVEEK